MKSGLMNRLVSMILVFAVVLGCVPVNIFAQDTKAALDSFEVTEVAYESDLSFTEPEEQEEQEDQEAKETQEETILYEEQLEPDISLMAVEYTTISGKVVDTNGSGISGVSVQVFDVTEGEVLELCTTGSNGSWTTSLPIIGNTYMVRYHDPRYTFANTDDWFVAPSGGIVLDNMEGVPNLEK